jgi:excisionase family DNA binding protein
MTSIKDKYLTIQSVSEILGCTERHVLDLILEKELIGLKIGSRATRVSEMSVVEFIERHTINPDDLFDPDNEKKQKENQQPVHTQQVARSKWIGR